MPTALENAKAAAVRMYLTMPQSNLFTAHAVNTEPTRNVVGVGIGVKLVNGQPAGPEVLHIYVKRKVPETAMQSEFILPKTIEGVPTDIVEVGSLGANAGAAVPVLPQPIATSPFRSRLRPMHPGGSVGFRFPQPGLVMAGTLGAVVSADGVLCMLSNNHVLANENQLPLGSPIFQPGLLDGGDPAKDQVATLLRFVPLNPAGDNQVDCAIARFLDPGGADPVFLPEVGKLASPTPIAAVGGMQVQKVGRTTKFTSGTVIGTNAAIRIQYSMGFINFDDQIVIQGNGGSFSGTDDSGSLIVDVASKRGVALLFAGSANITFGNRLDHVLSALGATLVV